MATKDELRQVVREEFRALVGERDIARDFSLMRIALRGIAAKLGLNTLHKPPDRIDA